MHKENTMREEIEKLLKQKRKTDICKEYGMSIEEFNGLVRRLGLTPLTMYEEDDLREMLINLLGFHTIQDVANMLSVNPRTVHYYMEKYDIDIDNKYKVKKVGKYYFLFLKNKLIGRVKEDCLEDIDESKYKHR